MKPETAQDIRWMREALKLARKGLGKTRPNPAVGCVIVSGGECIGKGYHRRAGAPHAEIEALRDCGDVSPEGATCYVTLEPCNHHGRTPPCTEALIQAGIARVVIAVRDPNRDVPGRGVETLREAGIRVDCGVCEAEARALNEGWLKRVTTGYPLVTMKFAASLDGKVATVSGQSRWISSENSRKHAHRFRRQVAAIMVGRGTVQSDDPALTARAGGRVVSAPLRIVVDSRLSLPLASRVFDPDLPGETLVATRERETAPRTGELKKRGVKVVTLDGAPEGGVNLSRLMETLGAMGIDTVLLEGGPTLAFSMLRERLVDKCMVYLSPKLIGGRNALSALEGAGFPRLEGTPALDGVTVRKLGSDLLVTGRVRYPEGNG